MYPSVHYPKTLVKRFQDFLAFPPEFSFQIHRLAMRKLTPAIIKAPIIGDTMYQMPSPEVNRAIKPNPAIVVPAREMRNLTNPLNPLKDLKVQPQLPI